MKERCYYEKNVMLSGVCEIGKTTISNYIKDNNLLDDYCILDIDDLESVHDYVDNYSKFYENAIKKADLISK